MTIVRLLVLAALLVLLSANTPARAWEVDPTKGIVPLDRAAELYRRGESDAAIDLLEKKMANYEALYAELVTFDEAIEERAFDQVERSLLRFNYLIATHLWCFIKSDWRDFGDPLVDCARPHTTTFYQWANKLTPHYAKMFIAHQLGDVRFSSGIVAMPNALYAGWERREDSPSLEAACGVYFTMQRFEDARLAQELLEKGALHAKDIRSLAQNDLDMWAPRSWQPERPDVSWPIEAKQRDLCKWHFEHLDEIGPLLVSQAILASIVGNDRLALNAGSSALERDAPLVFDNDDSHPLLWTLAAAHRLGDDRNTTKLTELARESRDDFDPDLYPALDIFIDGPSTDGTSPDCASAKCHYFTAQYFEGLGDREAATRELEAGASQCVDTASIPCTAISVEMDRSEAAPEP